MTKVTSDIKSQKYVKSTSQGCPNVLFWYFSEKYVKSTFRRVSNVLFRYFLFHDVTNIDYNISYEKHV